MPTTEREIVLRWIASAVAGRFLAASVGKVAAWNMDMLARLSVLEGAAGVSPGTWLRKKAAGFGAALDYFGPKLPAAWTTTQDQGLYNKALATATRALRSAQGTDATDLVQDMVSGSNTSSGPARTRVFYSVGAALRKYETDLIAGQMTPDHRRVKGVIDKWVTRAALDVLLSQKEQRHHQVRPDARSPLQTHSVKELDDDERSNLMLLALQSPGGPGAEVRRIIDHEIDRAFTKADRAIVRAFLEKIAQPKYRSTAEMKRLVSRFNPAKWFTQAYGLVRRDIMDELGVSAQQLTNALGGNAKNVFRFMREKVGKNSRVQKIILELADQIEILEPGVSRMAQASPEKDEEPKMRHSVLRRWLENKEREANLSSGNAFATHHEGPDDHGVQDQFEMNEHMDWSTQVGPHTQHGRGPSPLRVASAWMEAQDA